MSKASRRPAMTFIRSLPRPCRATLGALAAAALCGAAMLVGTASAYAQQEIKLGHVGEPGSLFQMSADEFARRANAKVGGKAKVVVFGSSQVGGDEEVLEKVKLGALAMA